MCGPRFHGTTFGHQFVHERSLHLDSHRRGRHPHLVPGMSGSRQRNQVHAADRKYKFAVYASHDGRRHAPVAHVGRVMEGAELGLIDLERAVMAKQQDVILTFFFLLQWQYFIVMFGIFVTMLVGGILGYAFRDKVASTMRTRMFASLGEYGQERAVTDAWDFTQSTVSLSMKSLHLAPMMRRAEQMRRGPGIRARELHKRQKEGRIRGQREILSTHN